MNSPIDEIWFAAKSTRIVYMPPKLLETFGETYVHYVVVAEDLDNPSLAHLHEGVVTAERPRIVTPQYYRQKMVENFGADAQRYFDEVLSKDASARFLQYGLKFSKQEYREQTVAGNAQEIAEQAAKDAQDNLRELRGVLIGADDTWEVSLLYFITQLVQRSFPYHARDIARRGLLDLQDGVPVAVRQEVEAELAACTTLEGARNLGAKLRDYGLFEQYEDQFYALYRRVRG
ncbi:MAG: hypothetical protein J6Y80_07140 [Victivallales bacterium]|nr:hypothetical protein [Victivallales bacterium]